jgi:hypothetical protein
MQIARRLHGKSDGIRPTLAAEGTHGVDELLVELALMPAAALNA